MVLDVNKIDLAEFLLHEMMSRTETLPHNCHLTVPKQTILMLKMYVLTMKRQTHDS